MGRANDRRLDARGDDARTARLLGLPGPTTLPRALRGRPVPPFPLRMLQAVAEKRGWLGYERGWLRPLRATQLGAGVADGRGPRFLIRVDEFPIYSGLDDDRYGYDASAAFHATMAAAGLPYMMAVVPQWTHAPLDPAGRGGGIWTHATVR